MFRSLAGRAFLCLLLMPALGALIIEGWPGGVLL
jgi:hypothetical protein